MQVGDAYVGRECVDGTELDATDLDAWAAEATWARGKEWTRVGVGMTGGRGDGTVAVMR